MKKNILVIILILIAVFLIWMNKSIAPTNETKLKVATLKGPAGIGMVKLMEENKYEFTIVNTPEEIVAKVTSGSVDIATVPTNLASTLHNKTNGDIQVFGTTTLGVLYILDSTGTVNSLSDLSGKTLYATGQASVPEYVINYILKENNILDVTIEYLKEHSDLATKALAGEAPIIMLPEPFVTTVLNKNENFKRAIDLTSEWKNINNSELPMGVIIAKKGVNLDTFIKDYKNSTEFTNTNIDEVASLAVKYEIIANIDIAKKAIPNCNIAFITQNNMKNDVSKFLEILYDFDAKSIGGKLPSEEFYY